MSLRGMAWPWGRRNDAGLSMPSALTDDSADPPLGLRALRREDEQAWRRLRRDSASHVRPWEPTLPPGAGPVPSRSFDEFVRELDAEAMAGRLVPWCITVRGALAGQVHLFSIVRGSQQSASVGYWVASDYVRRGIATRAVAMAVDHALGPMGLHRVEVNVRIENVASLGVVRRLGLREEGVRERFLHIDGAWRDHRSFAMTAEELPADGLLAHVTHPR